MKYRLDCRIVQDLLPSYVDGLTCEYTNQEVEAHVADCLECAEVLKRMQEPEMHIVEEAEVNYMKKIQKRMSKWKAASGTFVVLFLSVILLGVVLYSRLVPKEFEDVFGFEEDELVFVELTDTTTFSQSDLEEDELREFIELSAEEEITNDCLACLIYYQEKFQEKLTEEDREFLKAFSNIIKSWEKEDGTYN